MMDLKERPLIRKIFVYTIIGAVALFAYFDFSGLIGLTITIAVMFLIITTIYNFFIPQPVLQRQETDEEYYDMWEQMDADDLSRLKEEERLNQENIANQEALDRLL